jgi:uncharacterized membrane protein
MDKVEYFYNVVMRERKTGNTVRLVYSTTDCNVATALADEWNKKNIKDYVENVSNDTYIDYKSDGLFADVTIEEK